MRLANAKSIVLPFSQVELNLADSPYLLEPDQAVMLQNMDFDDQRGALVGRYGTTTLNPDGILLHDGITTAYYQFWDLFRCEDISNGNKYVLGVYDDLTNFKLAYCRTNNTAQTKFYTLKAAAGAPFNLTRNIRVNFCTAKCPTNGNIVLGFNGTDQPFWINLTTGVVTPFAFGGASDFRIQYVYPHPWKGHIWAAFRSAERNTIHWSSVTDYTSWVTDATSGFLQAPQNEPTNPVRAMLVVQDRMLVFNLDSIGEIYYTGVSDSPFKYRELTRNTGTFHFKSVVPWNGRVIYLDKTPPYLKMFNGSQIETLDPTGSIEKGFQKWLDCSVEELLKTRMDMRNGNLVVSFKAQPAYAVTGTDAKRWLAVVNMTRRNNQGMLYYPFNLWNIQSNDVICSDEGTDFGQTWYSDPVQQTVSGDSRYYVRRIMDWYDVRAGGVGFGDKRGTAATPLDVVYFFRTGWLNFGTSDWKEAMLFRLHGEWEGTPSTGAKFYVKYRFEKWTVWQQLEISAVALYAASIPFPQNAQGKLIQFEFYYSDKQSRPILHHIELSVRRKSGVVA